MGSRIRIIAIVVFGILLIPLIAMQFTSEVHWQLGDFVLAGLILFISGLVIDQIIRKIEEPNYRVAMIFMLVFIVFIVWAEFAVGIFS